MRAGTPAAITSSGIGLVTTEPAPTTRVPANVGEDDRGAPDPAPRADADHRRDAFLFANRDGRIIGAMSPCPARDMDASSDEHIALQMHQSEVASRSHVDVFLEDSAGLRERGAVTDGCGVMTRHAGHGRNARLKYWPRRPGDLEQRLRRRFEARSGPIITEAARHAMMRGATTMVASIVASVFRMSRMRSVRTRGEGDLAGSAWTAHRRWLRFDAAEFQTTALFPPVAAPRERVRPGQRARE